MSDNPDNKLNAFENLKAEFGPSNAPDHWPKVTFRSATRETMVVPLDVTLIRCQRSVGGGQTAPATVKLSSIVAYSEISDNRVEVLIEGGHQYVIEGSYDEINRVLMSAWRNEYEINKRAFQIRNDAAPSE